MNLLFSNKKYVAFLSVSLAAVLLVGCSDLNEGEPTATTVMEMVQMKETTPLEGTISNKEAVPEESDVLDVAIETPYATLYYPRQWEEYLEVESIPLDFGMDVIFFGRIAGEKYWLFSVHFGGADGIPIGPVQASEGYPIDVTVEISDYIPEEHWSEEDTELFYAMQEGMNHVIQKLMEDPAFID